MATRPPGLDDGRLPPDLFRLRPVRTEEPDATVVHGILIGCAACAPFWLTLLALTLR